MGNEVLVWIDGRLCPVGGARISPLDRGFLYGDGFFETTRIINGRALFLDRHVERLRASCEATGFGGTPWGDSLADAVGSLIGANEVGEGYLRITVTRGLRRGGLAELPADEPTVFMEARPMELPPPDAAPPISLAVSSCRRDEQSPLCRHKSLNYQLNILALAEARVQGADEACFLNHAGFLAEGATTNVFIVAEGAVRTPDVSCGLLPGITRGAVLQLCEDLAISAGEGRLTVDDLDRADEVFCTNSLRGVIPVTRLAGRPAYAPADLPVTRRLASAYGALARRACGLPA